jgi:hypothetical protein
MQGRALRFVVGCLLLAELFLTGCGLNRQKVELDASPGELTEMLAALTPKGFKIHGRVMWFTPENLYELIDGRAEFYLAYDMVGMCFVRFTTSPDSTIFINVSIYDMATPTNAFGVFSTERPLNSTQLKLGRDAYRSAADYYIWKGRYYVQIVTPHDSAEIRQLTTDMARKLTESLHDSNEPVWGLPALPKANLVPQSVRYYLVDAMALDFMRNTYMARYRRGETEVTVFLSQRDSVHAARAAIAGFIEHMKLYGDEVNRLTVDGIELLSCDMGGIYDIMFQKGCLVAGVTEVEDQNTAVQAAIDLSRQLQPE